AATALRVEDGEAIGQLAAGQVMVRNYDVDSRSAKPRHRTDGSRTAVARDSDLRTGRQRRIDARITQVVAVFDASRNEGHRLTAEPSDDPGQNGSGTDSIDVVVAVDENELLLAHRAHQPLDCLVLREKAH